MVRFPENPRPLPETGEDLVWPRCLELHQIIH